MGLLSKLGLKPTAAMLAGAGGSAVPRDAPSKAHGQEAPAQGKEAAARSAEMKALVARFQAVMARIKALEASKAAEAGALKKATIAAGNLSTSPKGIVRAHAALDQVEAQIEDAKLKLAAAEDAPADGPPDAKKVVSEARKRLKSLEDRGRKAIAVNPRNPNADWLTEVVGSSEKRIADLEERGTQREIDSVRDQLDWLEESVVRFEADAAEEASLPNAGELVIEARQLLKALEERGRKAIAADPRNSNAGWLTDAVADSEARIVDLEQQGTQREVDDVRKQLDWLEESIERMEADAEADAPAGGKLSAAGKKLSGALGKRFKALQERRRDPLAAQLKKDGKGSALEPADGKPVEDSPALKRAKAQFKRVMAEIRKLADAEVPEAEALKQAALAAGHLATSPKGIEQAMRALDKVMSDATQAKAEAGKAKAAGAKAEADAAKAAAETFDIAVGGKKLVGVHREEAMQALRLEVGKLGAQLEGGWAYHVDQMNLPNEVPFQAWLTTGVDAVKSFVKGQDAARIPDLNIWDPAREMMNEARRAEKKGDVKAIAALLPKLAASIPQARAKVGKYQSQMEGSAQTGVDAGRFVEDTAASTIGAVEELRSGSKANKVLAQSGAQAVFQSVEQLTEWMIGTRQHPDPGAVAQKFGEEAIGAIFKELVAGKLKGLFKSAFGSYLDKSISDAALKAMGLSRDAFMTAAQKYFAEFAAKQGAGLIKSAIAKLVNGKLPSSPEAMVDAIAAELTKGSSKQLIVDAVKELAKAAVVPK